MQEILLKGPVKAVSLESKLSGSLLQIRESENYFNNCREENGYPAKLSGI
jgi:hypothetical protein